jgi:hypothetical protein
LLRRQTKALLERNQQNHVAGVTVFAPWLAPKLADLVRIAALL